MTNWRRVGDDPAETQAKRQRRAAESRARIRARGQIPYSETAKREARQKEDGDGGR